MSCKAPTHNPHSTRDCTNQALCQGVELLVTNDGFTTGPQYMGPKWKDPVSTSAIPAYLGQNPLKFLFSDIHVSPTGSDVTGDGTVGRPYATIQRAVDAANEYDQVVLMSGTYVGLGNRGLRHHGKRIQLKSYNLCSTDSAGTTCASRVRGAQVVGLELDPLAVMTEATVAKANVGARHENDLVVLVGGIDCTLDGRVGSPDGAIPSDIRSRGGDMDVREEELQRVLAKVGWNCRSRDRILPLGAHVLRPSGEAIIR